MSGAILPVIPKRFLDFATLPVAGTQTLILADRVELLQWRELTMEVTVHNHTLGSGVGNIEIRLYAQSWTREPSVAFLAQNPVIAVTVQQTSPNPVFFTAPVSTLGVDAIAGMGRVVAFGSRASGGAMNATVSIEFALKNA